MSIHQMSATLDERQDRLLWRINTVQGQEFQFWLTRRMWLRLRPVFNQALLKLHASTPNLPVSDTLSLQMLRDFKRDNLLATADFKTPFSSRVKDAATESTPLLVTDAHVSLGANGTMEMALEQKDGMATSACRLSLTSDLAEGLLVLTHQALQNADWALPLETRPDDALPLNAPTPAAPSYRH